MATNNDLFNAASIGDVQKVVEFIEKDGLDPNCTNEDRWTAAHFAAEEGRVGVLRALKEKNTKINTSCKYGWTPAHLAAYHGHLHFLEVLLELGCVDDLTAAAGIQMKMPEDLANENGHLRCAQWLRNARQF